MILASGGGVFVTADGGKTWLQRGAAIEAFRQAESVAIDPQDPSHVFVGTWHLGYRSTDFGKTWVQNSRGMIPDSDIFSIAVDPRNPRTIYASACTGLYRSADRGLSWTRLKVLPNSCLVRAQVVLVDPRVAGRVYGGTTEGLFLSRDSGKSWVRCTPSDWVVNAVQIDGADSEIVMIGTELHGVMRSGDGGRTWAPSNRGFVSRSIAKILSDPAAKGRIMVGEFSDGKVGGYHVYDDTAGGWIRVARSDVPGVGMLSALRLPGGRGWIVGTARGAYFQRPGAAGWTGLPGPVVKLAVYDLAVDRSGAWVFAATDDGIYRARIDQLRFEKPSGYTFIPRVSSLLPSQDVAERILAGTHLGILRSTDSGRTWIYSSEGIPGNSIIESLASSPADGSRVFAGTSTGLFRSTDGGRTWRRLGDGRLGVDISAIVFLDAGGARVLAGDKTAGGVFLSEDAGAHWVKIRDAAFGSPVRSIAQDLLNPGRVYLGTASEGVYRLSLPRAGQEASAGVPRLR
jgi:photosystem II stability/assembly factor-like uncharacterized protein